MRGIIPATSRVVVTLAPGIRAFVIALLLLSLLPLVGSSPTQPKPNPELAELRKQGNAALSAGLITQSAGLYQRGFDIAAQSHLYYYQSIFRSNIASVDSLRFKYQDSLNGYLEARLFGALSHDATIQASIEFNIAGLYVTLGELEAAKQAVTRGLQLALPSHAAHYKLMACRALLTARDGDLATAIADFHEAIAEAARQRDNNAAAQWSDQLGDQMMLGPHPDFRAAEQAYDESLRFRGLSQNRGLRLTLFRRSWLRLEQGRVSESKRLLDWARSLSSPDTGVHPWFIYYLNARILQGQGRSRDAVAAFRVALRSGREFQKEAAPAGVLGSGSQSLLARVYRHLISASLIADRRLALDGFAATEEDRAASLRQTLIGSTAFIQHADPKYWAALAKLRSAQVGDFTADNPRTHRLVDDALLEVAELEAHAGVLEKNTITTRSLENNTSVKTLRHIQQGIRTDEALLSFHVASDCSLLWAVTRDRIELYRLPVDARVKGELVAFRSAVELGKPERDQLGESLYKELFGELDPVFIRKRVWLISAEDSFFEIPLAALVVESDKGKPVYLAQRHATLYTPSAMMLTTTSKPAAKGPFLGVGDGIYNKADQRWAPAKSLSSSRQAPNLEMVRLPGSGEELVSCARSWQSALTPILLTGGRLSLASFRSALERRPAIIHFATHFLTLPGSKDDALIHLGVQPSGNVDVLNEKDIVGLKTPNAVVAMSGCSSASSRALPMAGVLGLTRAWLIAGARVVIGSRWPTSDASGEMFESFYGRLQQRGSKQGLLRASVTSLQEAQIDMLRLGGWRSDPRFWGAFYVVGKE